MVVLIELERGKQRERGRDRERQREAGREKLRKADTNISSR